MSLSLESSRLIEPPLQYDFSRSRRHRTKLASSAHYRERTREREREGQILIERNFAIVWLPSQALSDATLALNYPPSLLPSTSQWESDILAWIPALERLFFFLSFHHRFFLNKQTIHGDSRKTLENSRFFACFLSTFLFDKYFNIFQNFHRLPDLKSCLDSY